MKLSQAICILAALTTLAPAERCERVGVVVAVSGPARVHHQGEADGPVQLLGSVRRWDVYTLPAGSRLTVSWLDSGSRYVLEGPGEVKIPNRELAPSAGVRKIDPAPGRTALVASRKFDLNRYGGGSSPAIEPTFATEEANPAIDLPAGFPVGKVYWREDGPESQSWQPAEFQAVDDLGRKRARLSGLQLQPGKGYLFARSPVEKRAELKIVRFSEPDLAPIRALEKSAGKDVQLRLAVLEAYRMLKLEDRVQRLVEKWRQDNPDGAPWDTYVKDMLNDS